MAEARIEVLRQNPDEGVQPHFQTYSVPLDAEKTTVLQALEYVFNNLDSTLAFRRYCCGLQFCNSCLMKIDGKTGRACLTVLEDGKTMRLEPLDGKVGRDLIPAE